MTLGQLFKSKRSELGRSLEQISAATKIHTKILSALENDEYAHLPARTFTRGFIVTYCKALKLNQDEVLTNYHDFLESKFAERHDRDKGHQGYVFEGKELEQNKRWTIIGATIAVLFAISVLLIFKPQNSHRKEKHKEFTEEEASAPAVNPGAPVVEPIVNGKGEPLNANSSIQVPMVMTTTNSSQATPAAASSVVPVAAASPLASPKAAATATPASAVAETSPTPAASPTPKEDKLNKGDDIVAKDIRRRVMFESSEDVWVRYQIDQKPPMTIILRKGRQLVVKAKEKLHVETNKVSALRYRKGAQFVSLEQASFAVEADGSLKTESVGTILPTAIPDTVPSSPTP